VQLLLPLLNSVALPQLNKEQQMAADALQDRFQVIGAPDTTADTTSAVAIGNAAAGVVHVVIGPGTPAPEPQP
jgi:hypothetical protein